MNYVIKLRDDPLLEIGCLHYLVTTFFSSLGKLFLP